MSCGPALAVAGAGVTDDESGGVAAIGAAEASVAGEAAGGVSSWASASEMAQIEINVVRNKNRAFIKVMCDNADFCVVGQAQLFRAMVDRPLRGRC